MKLSLALATISKTAPRSQAGDIIAVKPDGWQWGTEERKRYLILPLDLGSYTLSDRAAQALSIPRYSSLTWVRQDAAYTAKRRLSVPLADVVTWAATQGVTLDLAKAADQSLEYQPLSGLANGMPVLSAVYDKPNNRRIRVQDMTAIAALG